MVEIVKMVGNMCNMFLNVPDGFKTQKMHDKAVEKSQIMIRYVSTPS